MLDSLSSGRWRTRFRLTSALRIRFQSGTRNNALQKKCDREPGIGAKQFEAEFEWPVCGLDRNPGRDELVRIGECQFRRSTEDALVTRFTAVCDEMRIHRAERKAE